jgi:D-serine deaminase-like pyridoxal phosphate-dependent protein
MKRRTFVFGSVASLVGIGVWFKPTDNGQAYNSYFTQLNGLLKQSNHHVPNMLVDLDKLDNNINRLLQQLNSDTDFRIVAKSLPSPELLGYVMDKANTNKLMVFHQPFLNDISSRYPNSDVLMGKPMPVKAAEKYYQELGKTNTDFNPSKQLQWLIDSPERAKQYLQLAKQINRKLLLNVEIDVGLHRGGLQNTQQLSEILALIEKNSDFITFTGFMGYDPHVVKVPSILKSQEQAYAESQRTYKKYIEHLYEQYPGYRAQPLTFNGAGSPTLALHQTNTVCNELSAGSCLVKPTDFDIPSLSSFEAAAYIATPVLKKMKGTLLPAAEVAKNVLPLWDPNLQQTYFIYGGKWLADYESPQGLQGNALFGTSTNQQIVNGSYKTNLSIDDFVFLRPKQSEFVFLQFGQIIAVRNKQLVGNWHILSQV